jgi:anti-sigma B factor antagonist
MSDEKMRVENVAGTREGLRVLRCLGPMTIGSFFAFQEAAREEKAERVVVDMAEVPYMDSAGLGAIVQAAVSYQKQGRRLALAGMNERVRALFEMTHLERMFPMFATRAEAEHALAA